MAGIAVMSAALAGIRHATDIVKFIRESSTSLDNAEQKLKLAELIEALAETKIQLANIQTILTEKDQKIKELEEAFQSKDLLKKVGDTYFEMNDSWEAIGEPYCMHCWEVNHKKLHLHFSSRIHNEYSCGHCNNKYRMKKQEDQNIDVTIPSPRFRKPRSR